MCCRAENADMWMPNIPYIEKYLRKLLDCGKVEVVYTNNTNPSEDLKIRTPKLFDISMFKPTA